jgi:glycogen debranching enzyme
MDSPVLDQRILSAEGWPYASTMSLAAGDPGRFHSLFGRDSLIISLQVLPAQAGC